MAGIGRVSGSMLSSNLDRQGYPLNFVSGTNTLMHLDFSGSKVGINTDTVTESLTISGNLSTTGVLITDTTISAKNNATLFLTGQVNLGSNATVHMTGGNTSDIIITDGAGNLTWANVSALLYQEHFLQNVTINGATISTNTVNGNLTLQGNGSGYVTSPLMHVDTLTAGSITASSITGPLFGNLTGTVLTPAQPDITSLGTLTSLAVAGDITATAIAATLYGDVYTNNITGINGTLTVNPPANTNMTISGTSALQIPSGTLAQRPTAQPGAIRYNTTDAAPEYWNGSVWVSMAAEISSQTIQASGTNTFLLNHAPQSAQAIIVSINGTLQRPYTVGGVSDYSYTVSGNQLTFVDTPVTGDVIEVRFLTSATIVEFLQENAIVVSSPVWEVTPIPSLIDTFYLSEIRSVKYTISALSSDNVAQMSEVMLTQNGGTVDLAIASSAAVPVVTYTANIFAGNVNLYATSTSPTLMLRMYKLYFPV